MAKQLTQEKIEDLAGSMVGMAFIMQRLFCEADDEESSLLLTLRDLSALAYNTIRPAHRDRVVAIALQRMEGENDGDADTSTGGG